MTDSEMWFREPEEAFERAIEEGRLSIDPLEEHFAGNFMYMGSKGGLDYFKHKMTREYLAAQPRPVEIVAIVIRVYWRES